jgi:xanthine dehydrogenase molybdopterin-binding subunit B
MIASGCAEQRRTRLSTVCLHVEGKMQGGTAQGLGWALNEEFVYDAKGNW